MKKQIMLLGVALLVGFGAATAQEKQMTPTQRASMVVVDKLSVMNLGEDVSAKAKVILAAYYTNYESSIAALTAGGSANRDLVKAKKKELNDARDVKLKQIFTAAQFRIWKQEIEPTLRPQQDILEEQQAQ